MSMLNRWAEAQEKHTTIIDFFEWLQEQGLSVEITCQDAPTCEGPSALADRYLEIDRRKLEDERRGLLKGLG